MLTFLPSKQALNNCQFFKWRDRLEITGILNNKNIYDFNSGLSQSKYMVCVLNSYAFQ